MAKKPKKTSTRQPSITLVEHDVKVSKQAVGGVTGAVLGGMVAGPLGAVAGGFAGAVVGEQSARGRKPVKKTVDSIRSEIKQLKPMETLKSAAKSAKAFVSARTKKVAGPVEKSTAKSAAPKRKKKAVAAKKAVKKSKAKSAKRATTKKAAKKR
jgi:hypothetical protein